LRVKFERVLFWKLRLAACVGACPSTLPKLAGDIARAPPPLDTSPYRLSVRDLQLHDNDIPLLPH
jgi:hypothetical protein